MQKYTLSLLVWPCKSSAHVFLQKNYILLLLVYNYVKGRSQLSRMMAFSFNVLFLAIFKQILSTKVLHRVTVWVKSLWPHTFFTAGVTSEQVGSNSYCRERSSPLSYSIHMFYALNDIFCFNEGLLISDTWPEIRKYKELAFWWFGFTQRRGLCDSTGTCELVTGSRLDMSEL